MEMIDELMSVDDRYSGPSFVELAANKANAFNHHFTSVTETLDSTESATNDKSPVTLSYGNSLAPHPESNSSPSSLAHAHTPDLPLRQTAYTQPLAHQHAEIESTTDLDNKTDRQTSDAPETATDNDGSDHKPVTHSGLRYVCLSRKTHSAPCAQPILRRLPDISKQKDENGTLARRLKAIESYSAPSLYFADVPFSTGSVSTHLAAGELPIHFDYAFIRGATAKCDECKAIARGEVYKCLHCVAQICDECIQRKIEQEKADASQSWSWKGIKMHGAFKEAYLQRRTSCSTRDDSWEGEVQFSVDDDERYAVYVCIKAYPNKQHGPKKGHKRTRVAGNTVVGAEDTESELDTSRSSAGTTKRMRRTTNNNKKTPKTPLRKPTVSDINRASTTSSSALNNKLQKIKLRASTTVNPDLQLSSSSSSSVGGRGVSFSSSPISSTWPISPLSSPTSSSLSSSSGVAALDILATAAAAAAATASTSTEYEPTSINNNKNISTTNTTTSAFPSPLHLTPTSTNPPTSENSTPIPQCMIIPGSPSTALPTHVTCLFRLPGDSVTRQLSVISVIGRDDGGKVWNFQNGVH